MSDRRNALRVAVAEEVRVAMARKRINGARLASVIGRSQAYLSRRLTGETAFDVDDLERIADALGVPVVDLLPSDKVRPNNRSGAGANPAARHTKRAMPERAPHAGYPSGRSVRDPAGSAPAVPPTRRRPMPVRGPGQRIAG